MQVSQLPQSKRRLKALLFAAIVTGICSVPVWYLSRLHETTVIEDLGSQFRSLPFAYALENKPGVFTHVDAEQQVSLLFYFDGGRCKLERAACDPLVKEQQKLTDFLQRELTPREKSGGKGKSIRAVALIRGEMPVTLSSHWDVVRLDDEEALPLPPAMDSDAPAAFIVMDDDGFVRSYLTAATEQRQTKLVTILRKTASQQNLMDYLTQQTLMWEKAKRIARGKELDPKS